MRNTRNGVKTPVDAKAGTLPETIKTSVNLEKDTTSMYRSWKGLNPGTMDKWLFNEALRRFFNNELPKRARA